jgi:hypothetical protein
MGFLNLNLSPAAHTGGVQTTEADTGNVLCLACIVQGCLTKGQGVVEYTCDSCSRSGPGPGACASLPCSYWFPPVQFSASHCLLLFPESETGR